MLNESSYGSLTLRKLHAWEKPGSQFTAKNGTRPMRFQYSLIDNISTNRLISHFDFCHVDRHEWKEQGSSRGFLKKFSFGQVSHFMPKNCTAS